MQEVTIRLHTPKEVEALAEIAVNSGCRMDLVAGRCIVSARSVIGILSMGMGRDMQLKIYSDDCGDLLEQLTPFLVGNT